MWIRRTRHGEGTLTSESRQFEVVHFGQHDQQWKFLLFDGQFELGPTSDDLQTRQNDFVDVYVRDQNVSGHFPYVLQKTEVQVFVLQPREFQVAVHVSAVGVSVPEIPVMVVPIRRHG